MLTTLIRRELLDNLMTFRFAVAVFITLLLVVANTAVLLKDYEQRLMDYNDAVKKHQRQLQAKKTYSAGEVRIDRPLNPLSIFNAGYDKRVGNQVHVSHTYVPSLWDAGWHGANPFMDMFTSMDIVFIFEVILSLLALIFAYDTLVGESERGTLRLVLTSHVRRGYILLAKYISAMLCLLVPLLMSLLLAVILLTTTPSISLNTDDFLRIGGIIFASVAYLSVFYLIGLLISAATRRTSTALMLSMFVWGVLVLVYPNVILAVIPHSEVPQARAASAFSQIEQIWEGEFERERRHFLATDAFPGIDWNLGLRGSGSDPYAYLWGDPRTLKYSFEGILAFEEFDEKEEQKIPHAQNHFRYTCVFLALGLLVSARVQRSAVSLVILLLAWVTLVVFMPSTLASIAGHSSSSSLRTDLGFWERREEFDTRWHEARQDRRKQLQLSGEYVTKDAEQRERSHEEHLKRRISQVNRARTITRLSPVTIVEHLLDSFAGTGFERHLQFLENVQSYARQFREFIVDTDRADPESLHIIGVREGVSQKPVNPEAVPKFEDTRNFRRDFNTAVIDLLLLTLFFVVFFSGAFLAFVRVEI